MCIVAITGPRQNGRTTITLQVRQRLTKPIIPCRYVPMYDIDSIEPHYTRIQEISSEVRTGAPFNEHIPPDYRGSLQGFPSVKAKLSAVS